MKTLVLTYGSRGDLEPFLALAVGLKNAGHAVTLCSAGRYESWAAQHGIAFAPASDALLDLMDTEEGRAAFEGATGVIGAMRAGLKLANVVKPINWQVMSDCWAAAKKAAPDLILYHPKSMAAPHIAEKLGVPAIMAVLQPMFVPTTAFPVAGMPDIGFGGWYNKLTYKAVAAGFRSYARAIHRFREDTLGLPKLKESAALPRQVHGRPITVLHGFSAHVVPRPEDWPEHAQITGYWRLAPDGEWSPPPDLAAFLSAGEPPVYIGFGSMVGRDPRGLAALAVAALKRVGRRGVLATGWGGLESDNLPDSVLKIEAAPHSWLFPRMAAVVHHGGAGTTAAGLHAGRPAVICPFIGDQPFWAARCAELGIGPRPVSRKKLSVERLAAAIQAATSDEKLRANAERLANCLQAENGVDRAVSVMETVARSNGRGSHGGA